jgi:hypothetical protein
MSHEPSSSSMRRRLIAATFLLATLPVVALASPVDIPYAFVDGDTIVAEEFNENFDAIADAINDNDARIAALESSADGGVPTGTIAFFDADTCPVGWVEHADLRGRVPLGLPTSGTVGAGVGTPLEDEGLRNITQVVAHSHGPGTLAGTAAAAGGHSHTVDPASFTTSEGGGHFHTITNMGAGNGVSWRPHWSGTVNPAAGDYNTPTGGAHTHSINVPATTSSSEPNHSHSVSVSGGSTASAGAASVDVTMPYMQLLACRRT